MQYTVVYEESRTGWGAYPPDLPGCGATGRTLALVKRRIRWAIKAHIQGLREDGLPVPRPRALAEVVEEVRHKFHRGSVRANVAMDEQILVSGLGFSRAASVSTISGFSHCAAFPVTEAGPSGGRCLARLKPCPDTNT